MKSVNKILFIFFFSLNKFCFLPPQRTFETGTYTFQMTLLMPDGLTCYKWGMLIMMIEKKRREMLVKVLSRKMYGKLRCLKSVENENATENRDDKKGNVILKCPSKTRK